MDHFGTQLRGMTLTQLGQATGVSQGHLSRLERRGEREARHTASNPQSAGAEHREAEFAAMPNEPCRVEKNAPIENALGNRIRAMREQRGLSQGELARAAGMYQSCLSTLERGRQLTTPDRLHAILAALGATDRAAEFDRLAMKERTVIKFTLHSGTPQTVRACFATSARHTAQTGSRSWSARRSPSCSSNARPRDTSLGTLSPCDRSSSTGRVRRLRQVPMLRGLGCLHNPDPQLPRQKLCPIFPGRAVYVPGQPALISGSSTRDVENPSAAAKTKTRLLKGNTSERWVAALFYRLWPSPGSRQPPRRRRKDRTPCSTRRGPPA